MQPLFERAQLRVVQRARRLLTIARDEWHRGTTVEQSHGGFDLLFTNAEHFRDLPTNGCRHARTSCRRRLWLVNRNRPRSPTGIAYGRSAIDSSTPAEFNEPTLSAARWRGHSESYMPSRPLPPRAA